MRYEDLNDCLSGRIVRLEPLCLEHADPLAQAAAAGGADLYKWTSVPNGDAEALAYVERATAAHRDGLALPFAILRQSDDAVIGSTRLYNFDRWQWPPSHPRQGSVDGAEIGHTWLSADAIRTGANLEAKLMLLTAAFEQCGLLRICFHTDARNERSANALRGLGAHFEGFLRAHRLGVDAAPRTSARFSIVREEWLEVKRGLQERLGL